MFEFLTKSKAQPIGLDVGHSVIKMIQLGRNDQTIFVEAAEEEVLDRTLEPGSQAWREQVIDLLKTLYNRGGFRGQDVVSCLPGDVVKIKSLRLDSGRPEEIEDVINTEVAKRFDMNPERDEIRYMIAGDAYQGSEIKNEVIFFGIEQEQLTRHIELIEAAGLIPISLDTVPSALFRCFQTTLRRREDQELVSVFVDLGSQFTAVIIGRGQEIAFVKQIPIAGDHLNQQVAQKLGISLEEAADLRDRLRHADSDHVEIDMKRTIIDAMSGSIESLAHEISLCFRYYAVTFRGQRPTKAAFSGGEAYESALIEALQKRLGVEICVAEPLRGFDLTRVAFNRRPNPLMCEWAIAVGLALKGVELSEKQNLKHEKVITV
ncbi:MAG: pilus assembly protein PilM [Phycisphaerae bacterium]|nr:pilus assembly protein PilM [Phycisphaerae bacterium]